MVINVKEGQWWWLAMDLKIKGGSGWLCYYYYLFIFSNCQQWCMVIEGIGDFFLVVLMRVYGSGFVVVGIFFSYYLF